MPEAHSKYSASGFEAAMLCQGKRVMEAGKPDSSSKYADEGTAAHGVLEAALTDDRPAAYYVGTRYPLPGQHKTVEVTTDMAVAVQTAIDNIKTIVGDGMLLTEQRVCYAEALGVPADQAWGTSDIIAARGTELQVHDYKHGMGVEVDAGHNTLEGSIEPNPQMALYGLGALAQCQGILGDFETVRLVIHQPRIKDAPSEYVISVSAMLAWGRFVAKPAVEKQEGAARMHGQLTQREWEAIYLQPNEKSCKFCKAKATCPALRNEVANTVTANTGAATPDEFDALDDVLATPGSSPCSDAEWLAVCLAKTDLIEDWLKAVRAEVERRLHAGKTVPGYKLVQGKQGNRAWGDKTAAEAALKAMRLKTEEMYELSLISPTTAEKLAKPAKKDTDPAPLIGPRQWPKLQDLITRAAGKAHVAPVSDPRPALDVQPVVDDFESTTVDAVDFA